jgi:hypothetical protein
MVGWAFDLVFDELGGFLVESNQGHFGNEGNTGVSGDLELFGASAETGVYAKAFAKQVYGEAPHHSYVWGGSGGGLRSTTCIENRPDVWDGAVPFVIGEASGSSALPLTLAYWWLYCRHRRDDIIDAVEPGGSGDPFAGLADDERRALATVYRGGWNRGAETQLWASASWMFGLAGLKANDPTYFDEFWSRSGYLGHDRPEQLDRVLVDATCKVTRIQRGADGPGQMWLPLLAGMGEASGQPERGSAYGIEVDADFGDDPYRLYMAKATVLSGKAAGREVFIARQGDLLLGERMTAPDMFDDVEPGDEIRIDNRDLIAWGHRWMYAIDLDRWTAKDASGGRALAPEFAGMGMAMLDGKPIYPQRTKFGLPPSQFGKIERKVIHISCTHDTIVPLPSVGQYHRMICEHLGERTDDLYRFWWMENAPHGLAEVLLPWTMPEKDPGLWRSRLVGYDGAVQQALVSLVSWVEDGVPPAPTTSYRYTADSGLVLAASAAERGGVQPVVRAKANGQLRADVRVGEPVAFTGYADQPPGAGTIVFARWDFEGVGEFAHEHSLQGDHPSVTVEATHAYDKPGVYFASFRAGAHRDGQAARGLPIENGARVRVVVSA